MLTHDWVVMHLNGSAVVRAAAAVLLDRGAVREGVRRRRAFAMRLPSALATIAMGGAVGYATARIAGGRAGMVAAIVLSTSLMQAIVGRLAIMDALLDFCGRRRGAVVVPRVRAVAAARAGATPRSSAAPSRWRSARWPKGPVAPVIAVLVIGVWLLWERRAGRLAAPRGRAIVIAALAYVAVTLPWFVALARARRPGRDRRADRALHVRPLHGRDREPDRAVVVLRPGRDPGLLPVDRVRAGRRRRRVARSASRPTARSRGSRSSGPSCRSCSSASRARSCRTTSRCCCPRSRSSSRCGSSACAPARTAARPSSPPRRSRSSSAASRSRSRSSRAATVSRSTSRRSTTQLAFLGVAMLAGSLLTVVAIARRDTAEWSPYVLALTSGALVLFIALVAEPAAEPLKPIPPIARTIDAQPQTGRRRRDRRRERRQRADLLHRAARARHQEQRRVRLDRLRERRRVGRRRARRTPSASRRWRDRTGARRDVVMQTPTADDARAALLHVAGRNCD